MKTKTGYARLHALLVDDDELAQVYSGLDIITPDGYPAEDRRLSADILKVIEHLFK